jgi:hypothetical protein
VSLCVPSAPLVGLRARWCPLMAARALCVPTYLSVFLYSSLCPPMPPCAPLWPLASRFVPPWGGRGPRSGFNSDRNRIFPRLPQDQPRINLRAYLRSFVSLCAHQCPLVPRCASVCPCMSLHDPLGWEGTPPQSKTRRTSPNPEEGICPLVISVIRFL